MRELQPGLWHWRAPHPDWEPSEPAIVLTAPWHERDAECLVERHGARVYTPLPDTAQYLMDTYGLTAEQAGDGSPDVVVLLRRAPPAEAPVRREG